MTIVRYILFFLLFLLPFVVLPFGVSHYETPKVVLTEISILFLVGVWLLSSHKTFQRNNLLLIGALFAVSLISLVSHNSATVFLGNSYRWQGTFLFWLLMAFSLIVPAIPLPVQGKWVYFSLLIGHLFMAFSGVLNTEGRSVGTLGEPNALAAAVIFVWPWLLARDKESKRQRVKEGVWVFAGVGVSLLIVLLSGSRSGLLALGLQVCMLVASKFLPLKIVAITGVVVLLGTMILPLTDKQTVYENRGDIWKTALIAGYEHPLGGWGFGNVEVAMKEYNKKLYNNLQGYYVDSAHNFLLDSWVAGGLVGLSLIVLLIYQAIKQFVITGNTRNLILLLGVLTVMSFNPVSIVTLIQFWWLLFIL